MIFVISKSTRRNPKDLFSILLKNMNTNVAPPSEKEANKDSKLMPEAKQTEPVFLQRETKLKAGIYEGQISFNLQSTTRTNWKLFRHDIWQWIVDFMDTLSQRNELKLSHLTAEELKNELLSARDAKKDVDKKLEELCSKLLQCSREIEVVPPDDKLSRNCLKLLTQKNDLKDLEHKLKVKQKNLNTKEENYFQLFLLAIDKSNEKEETHTHFLKTAILLGIVFTLILATTASYIYNFNLINDLRTAAGKISDLTKKLQSEDVPTSNQSWGSSLKGYVRPLYGWALPKK